MSEIIRDYLRRAGVRRLMIFAILLFAMFLLKSMMNLMLLTFIFAYLMDRSTEYIHEKVPINRKIIVIILYVAFVSLLTFGVVNYLPVVVREISQLAKQLMNFYTQPRDNVVLNYIVEKIQGQSQITNYVKQGFTYLLAYFTDLSKMGLDLFLSLILSLFYLLEKQRLMAFTRKFKDSKLHVFYQEIEYFGGKFVGTFGKVIEAQFMIAIVNVIVTTIGLAIMGFPQLFGLAIMVFVLGLIPVAGVMISLIPLGFIAYSMHGFIYVLYVLILVAVVHTIEAYILNPKLMSSKTNVPVFYTFIVLIFSQHFFGIWGLILGIPLFVFLLDLIGVENEEMALPALIKKKRRN